MIESQFCVRSANFHLVSFIQLIPKPFDSCGPSIGSCDVVEREETLRELTVDLEVSFDGFVAVIGID